MNSLQSFYTRIVMWGLAIPPGAHPQTWEYNEGTAPSLSAPTDGMESTESVSKSNENVLQTALPVGKRCIKTLAESVDIDVDATLRMKPATAKPHVAQTLVDMTAATPGTRARKATHVTVRRPPAPTQPALPSVIAEESMVLTGEETLVVLDSARYFRELPVPVTEEPVPITEEKSTPDSVSILLDDPEPSPPQSRAGPLPTQRLARRPAPTPPNMTWSWRGRNLSSCNSLLGTGVSTSTGSTVVKTQSSQHSMPKLPEQASPPTQWWSNQDTLY